MAVVTVKSTLITNREASPPVQNPVTFEGGRRRSKVATVEVANGDSIGSRYKLFSVPSNARVMAINVYCDAITSAAADFGIYQTAENGAAVVNANAYGAAQSIATALTMLPVNVAFKTRDIANIAKRVWQDAGLSDDSQREYYIEATLTAAATAAGTLSAELVYVID